MHKKVYVFLLVCLLLTGCSSDETKPSVENEKNLIIDIKMNHGKIQRMH